MKRNTKKRLVLLVLLAVSNMLPAQKKNILFIAVDDLKPVLNCYGASQVKSPNIDRLADQGIVFSNAYCAWSVCGPSRASMLSGLTPDGTGIKNLRTQIRDVRPDAITLPLFFKNKGYETIGIGKIYDPRTVDAGHDTRSWTKAYIPIGSYSYPEKYGSFVKGQYRVKANTVTETGPEGVGFDGYEDGQSCLLALKYLDELAAEQKPFFLAVGFKKPHIPFIAPKKYWDMYDRDKIELAPFQDTVAGAPSYIYFKPEPNPDKYVDIPDIWNYTDVTEKMDTALQKRIIHGYYACTSYIDDLVGKLLDKLEEKGLAGNTIIVLWGDHGYHLGDHNQWGKHTNFENGTHLPLIIVVPDGKGGVCYEPVDSYDIYPTLVDLAGFDVPEFLEGDLLTPALKGEKLNKTCAVSQFRAGGNMGYSFRTGRYRFTVWMDKVSYIPTDIAWDENKIEDIELYDYVADSLERVNLANKPEYQQVKDSLLSIARNWWNEQHYFYLTGKSLKYITGVNYILNNPGFEEGVGNGWTLSEKNGFSAELSRAVEAGTGDDIACVKVISPGGSYDDGKLMTEKYNCLSGIRGKRAVISFRAKASDASVIKTEFKVYNFDGTENVFVSPDMELSDKFIRYEYEVNVPESAADWEISLLTGKATGEIYIDDVSFKLKEGD
ncbi:MAG: sulfatase [Chlorobi bacterium]|nr:sulfatase [Chlorobiota bacterium]